MTQKTKWTPQVGDRAKIEDRGTYRATGEIIGPSPKKDHWHLKLDRVGITVEVPRDDLIRLVKKKKPEKREPEVRWINIYSEANQDWAHTTKEEAARNAHPEVIRIAVKFVEVVE